MEILDNIKNTKIWFHKCQEAEDRPVHVSFCKTIANLVWTDCTSFKEKGFWKRGFYAHALCIYLIGLKTNI